MDVNWTCSHVTPSYLDHQCGLGCTLNFCSMVYILSCEWLTESMIYRIVGNFRGRKLSQILRFCGYMQKFSPQNLGRGILWHGKSGQSAKVFSAKIVFFTNLQFSPSKVSHYTVHGCLTITSCQKMDPVMSWFYHWPSCVVGIEHKLTTLHIAGI